MVDLFKTQTFNPVTIAHVAGNRELFDSEKNVTFNTANNLKVEYDHFTYKNLEFQLYYPHEKFEREKLIVKGSAHKYWNNGKHNYNDFNNCSFVKVVRELESKFKLVLNECVVQNLEVGVNIVPPYSTIQILKNCLGEKFNVNISKAESKIDGHYVQVKKSRYYLKYYDKAYQYRQRGYCIPHDIFRIEKKYTRNEGILKDFGVRTLEDLLEVDFRLFEPQLVGMWESLLFYDWTVLDGTKFQDKYSNPVYWGSLKQSNFKKQKRNMARLISNEPNNLKRDISNLISAKVRELEKPLLEVIPIGDKQILMENRLCEVTGVDISMQRGDSELLSHKGLKYYYAKHRNLFKELKREYLSEMWLNSSLDIQIREIAHNIRNKKNNQRIKQKRIYPYWQRDLLSAFAR